MSREMPPNVLQIYRDRVKPGAEPAYRRVEEDAARICVERNCPHPHLAMESLAGPREVWWLNAFASEDDRQRVTGEYLANGSLMAALAHIGRHKEGLTDTPIDMISSYRADLSDAAWRVAGVRFFVAEVTRGVASLRGSVFDATDGTRYVLRPVGSEAEAETLAGVGDSEITAFAVRPWWGFPASEWITADPEFWRENPAGRSK